MEQSLGTNLRQPTAELRAFQKLRDNIANPLLIWHEYQLEKQSDELKMRFGR